MKAIIAAAGTGGHINPGIAIANKIKEKEPDSEIIFIGTPRGIENDLVPRAGYELKTVNSYGFSKKPTLENIKNTIKTIMSVGEAKKIIKAFKPDIIIGTGGYICMSVCLAGKSLKVPYIIHESNVLPGKATKVLSKNAKAILLGFKESKERLNPEVNTIVTGTPVKAKNLNLGEQEIKNIKIKRGLEPDIPLVLAFGGSQGARSINMAFKDIAIDRSKNKEQIKYQVMWSAGQKQYDDVKDVLQENKINIENLNGIKVFPYIYDMEEVMNIADLVVCRSGAMTVTEIERIGKPSILIPYPFAAENHQEYNARALEKAGSAEVILNKDLNSTSLNDTINKLIQNPEKLKQMGQKAKSLSIEDVEEKIYNEIKKLV